MSAYLIEHGGVSPDRVLIIGPFGDVNEAWAFTAALDDKPSEFRTPSSLRVFAGNVTDALQALGVTSPTERLREEVDDFDEPEKWDPEDPTLGIEEEVAIFDRHWPTWRQERQQEARRQQEDQAQREAECQASGHRWSEWRPYYNASGREYRTCDHCWRHEEQSLSEAGQEILAREAERSARANRLLR
jgi:hypothetical protein